LANAYSWTQDYILDNLTLEEIGQHVKWIQKANNISLRNITESNFYATAYSQGAIKKKTYDMYLNMLAPIKIKKNINVSKTVDDMKRRGLPVEEK